MEDQYRTLTPHLPPYRIACHFIRQLDTVPLALVRTVFDEIWAQRGSPQQQVEWANPDQWITQRLSEEVRDLALKLWEGSKRELNPRYYRGPWLFSQNHQLLISDESESLRLTPKGKAFLESPRGSVVAEIDQLEGMLIVLKLVAELGPGKRSVFLPAFSDFCQENTSYRSEVVIKGAQYDRLFNLIDRGFLTRSGQTYEVTELGLSYLETFGKLLSGRVKREQSTSLERQAQALRQEARQHLAEYLSHMNPFKFEELIKRLLEEMGYNEVEVTSPVNDKGVDVVANIQLGISSVREVVQVKRHKGNINRVVLDQLRGSLHRFNAVRGTIITTGGFSKGTTEAAFERAAAPITLIDGEKLLDLLIEYEIGVKPREVKYYEFDETLLKMFEEEGA